MNKKDEAIIIFNDDLFNTEDNLVFPVYRFISL